MTRDASRRLRLAKRAAKKVLASGGSLAEAAAAAQEYGTPADGADSEASDSGEGDDAVDEVGAYAASLQQLSIAEDAGAAEAAAAAEQVDSQRAAGSSAEPKDNTQLEDGDSTT